MNNVGLVSGNPGVSASRNGSLHFFDARFQRAARITTSVRRSFDRAVKPATSEVTVG